MRLYELQMKKSKNHDAGPVPLTKLVLPEWDGSNAKGKETRELILKTALSTLVDEGYQAMSMRRVAAKCGLQFGNLTYHYPTREDLITELLEAVIRGYEAHGDAIAGKEHGTVDVRLARIFGFALEDLRTKKTTHLFPELWALSNHDPVIAERVQALYYRARAPLEGIVEELRPDLPSEVRTALSVFMSSTIEGLSVFAGYEKPFEPWIPAFTRIASSSFIKMLKDFSIDDLGDIDLTSG